MDFQSMMETFAEAWVAANTQTPLTDAAAAATAANANDHANLFMGLSGSGVGGGGQQSTGGAVTGSNAPSPMDMGVLTNEPIVVGAHRHRQASSSSNQSPTAGLNLSSTSVSSSQQHNAANPTINQQQSSSTPTNELDDVHACLSSPFNPSTTNNNINNNNNNNNININNNNTVIGTPSHLIDIKDVIGGGSNNVRNTLPIHCIIERLNGSMVTGSGGGSNDSRSQQQQQQPCQASTPPLLNQANQSTNDLSMVNPSVSNSTSTSPTSNTGTTGTNLGVCGSTNAANNAVSGAAVGSSMVIEQDTYAILPSTIPFIDIIRAVLTKLGYASQEMAGAKAFVQLRNWKQLALEQISDSTELTIGDIFSDICSFITLRIRLCRPRMNAAHELKDKLLQVLLAHSYSLLTTNNSGSSIDQQILSSLIRGRDQQQQQQQELNDDARRRFDQWYLQQVFHQYRQLALAAQQQSSLAATATGLRPTSQSPGSGIQAAANHPLFMDINNLANGNDTTLAAAAVAGFNPTLAAAAAAAAASAASIRSNSGGNTNGSINASGNTCLNQESKSYGGHHHNHKQNNNNQNNNSNHHNSSNTHHSSSMTGGSRTRIRTSFDPELELPKLHKWFAENRHPSRSQVQEYVKELNSLESRKGRKPLDVNNVVYWFKNARAAHKRAELKFVSNDSNLSNHSFAGFHHQGVNHSSLANDFFATLNGGGGLNSGNHSPGKASSDASVSGKCNDEPMSNASRNGSNLDDYYSFDEDADSPEETQTLDLSIRNHPLCIVSQHTSNKMNQSESPQSQKQADDDNECDDLKFSMDDLNKRQDLNDNADMLDHPAMVRNAVDCSSDCNSADDDSDDETEATSLPNNFVHQNSNNSVTHNITNSISSTLNHNSSGSSQNPESPEGRRARRSRTFIDPMSEVPRLESWFMNNTHPSHTQIVRYTDELNKMPYRQKFPKLEPKNIQFWFKNRRAKIKRTASGLNPTASTLNLSTTAAATMVGPSLTTTPNSSNNNNSPNSTSLTNSTTSIHNSSALNIERLINAH